MSDSQSPETALLILRERCLAALVERLKATGKAQVQLASELGITPSRVSALMQGRADEFRLDMLVTLAVRAGGVVTDAELVTFPRARATRKR